MNRKGMRPWLTFECRCGWRSESFRNKTDRIRNQAKLHHKQCQTARDNGFATTPMPVGELVPVKELWDAHEDIRKAESRADELQQKYDDMRALADYRLRKLAGLDEEE